MTQDDLIETLEEIGVQKLRVRGANVTGCCPFHSESNPSWGINVNFPHLHGCFACGARGDLVSLLIRIGGFTLKEASIRAGHGISQYQLPRLVEPSKKDKEIDLEELFPFYPHPRMFHYLRSRGVKKETVIRARLLYDRRQRRVIFVWKNRKKVSCVTGRSVDNEQEFRTIPYFESKKSGQLYIPVNFSSKVIVLVEGEIDALRVYQATKKLSGALGFGAFTKSHADFILSSGIVSVILFFDHDKTGKRLTEDAQKLLSGKCFVHPVAYPLGCDPGCDPAELTDSMIVKVVKKAEERYF